MNDNKVDEFEEMLKRVSTLEAALEDDGEIEIDYDSIIQEFGLDVEELERAMESMQPTIKLQYSKSNSDATSPSEGIGYSSLSMSKVKNTFTFIIYPCVLLVYLSTT